MNQNIWPCVSDMAPCPPWTWVSRWGKTQPLKSFSLVSGAGTTPLQPGCLGAEQPLAGVTSTEAAEEEGHHHNGGDPLQAVLVQGKYSVLVQPLRGERLGAWELLGHVVGEGRGGWGRDAPHQAGSVARAHGSTAALWWVPCLPRCHMHLMTCVCTAGPSHAPDLSHMCAH